MLRYSAFWGRVKHIVKNLQEASRSYQGHGLPPSILHLLCSTLDMGTMPDFSSLKHKKDSMSPHQQIFIHCEILSVICFLKEELGIKVGLDNLF